MAARHFTDTCDRICLLLYQSAGAEYPFSRLLVFCDPDGICIRNCIIVPLRLEKRACFLREKGAGYPKRNNGSLQVSVLSGRRTFADLSDRFCSFFTDYQCKEVSEAYVGGGTRFYSRYQRSGF